jgi:SAM-dependent methyltransferase
MIFSKFISKKLLSEQLKQPSGWIGKYIISKLLDTSSYQLNSFTLELLDIDKKDKILEIGFGTGLLIKRMAKEMEDGTIEGVDFSKTMYNRAFEVNKEQIQKKRVTLHHLECKKLPFENNNFTKVCSINTLYFWENPEEYFQEILRVIKENGHFVLGFRDKKQMELLDADKEIFQTYEKEEIIEMLSRSGFKNIKLNKRDDTPLTSYCIVAIK